jgi:hypothetical protein
LLSAGRDNTVIVNTREGHGKYHYVFSSSQTCLDGLRIEVSQNQWKIASHEYSLNSRHLPPRGEKNKKKTVLSFKDNRLAVFWENSSSFFREPNKTLLRSSRLLTSNFGDITFSIAISGHKDQLPVFVS